MSEGAVAIVRTGTGATPAPALRRRRSSEDARREILDAAQQLFAERGYSGTTTRDIAQRASASEALIFRYFQSKANLFQQAIVVPFESRLQHFLIAHQPREIAPFAGSREFVDGLFRLLREDADSLRALLTTRLYDADALERGDDGEPDAVSSGANAATIRAYFGHSVKRMQSELASLGINPAIGIELSTRFGFATVVATALFREWIFADTGHEDTDLTSALSQFILAGMSAQDPGKVRGAD